jgi:hypothetical protein
MAASLMFVAALLERLKHDAAWRYEVAAQQLIRDGLAGLRTLDDRLWLVLLMGETQPRFSTSGHERRLAFRAARSGLQLLHDRSIAQRLYTSTHCRNSAYPHHDQALHHLKFVR